VIADDVGNATANKKLKLPGVDFLEPGDVLEVQILKIDLDTFTKPTPQTEKTRPFLAQRRVSSATATANNTPHGQPEYFFSNHDQRRHWDRYGDGAHNDQIAS
jgi:hypothetical protein